MQVRQDQRRSAHHARFFITLLQASRYGQTALRRSASICVKLDSVHYSGAYFLGVLDWTPEVSLLMFDQIEDVIQHYMSGVVTVWANICASLCRFQSVCLQSSDNVVGTAASWD